MRGTDRIEKKRKSHFRKPTNDRRFIITINVPVVFMARYVMVLRGATLLRGALEGVGPENRDLGPEMARAEKKRKSHCRKPTNDRRFIKVTLDYLLK
jgi:hypothetical protein